MAAREDLVCDCEVIHGDIVDAVKTKMPDDENIYDLSDFFKVLGDISVEPKLQDEAKIALKNISKPAENRFS
jgi:hypothetical protein